MSISVEGGSKDKSTHIAGVVKVRKDFEPEDFERALKQSLDALGRDMTKRYNNIRKGKK